MLYGILDGILEYKRHISEKTSEIHIKFLKSKKKDRREYEERLTMDIEYCVIFIILILHNTSRSKEDFTFLF